MEHYKKAAALVARRVVPRNTSIGRVAFPTIPTILDVSIKSLPKIAADVESPHFGPLRCADQRSALRTKYEARNSKH